MDMVGFERLSRSEAVASAIDNLIEVEKLAAGSKLGTKADLLRRFDVGVGTLNEALRILDSKGSVSLKPGPRGGVFVATRSPLVRLGHKMLALSGDSVSVADCLRVRDALDPLVVTQAARHRSASDIRNLWKVARDMEDSNLSALDYLRLNWLLHRRILEIVPNQVLQSVYSSLLDYIEERVLEVNEQPSPVEREHSVAVHLALVEAIESGDEVRAAKAADAHQNLVHGAFNSRETGI